MSRANDRIAFNVNNGAASGAGTTTSYFVISDDRPVMFKQATVTGINPASTDGDTLNSIWDYIVTGGSAYVNLSVDGAVEYNDTDDTNSYGTIGTNAATVKASLAAEDETRVPAGAVIRHREVWAGTVGDGHALHTAEFTVL
jgi:hypothetical protein